MKDEEKVFERKFALENLTSNYCSGWCVRSDGELAEITILKDGEIIGKGFANSVREDVDEAGLGPANSGFEIFFNEDFSDGEIELYDNDILLGEASIKEFSNAKKLEYKSDVSRKKLLKSVEPFTEIDVRKSRLEIMDEVIIAQSREVIRAALDGGEEKLEKEKVINILGEIYAEMHYLKTAYLQNVVYQDPNFSLRIPKNAKTRLLPDEIKLDLKGQVTGSNWYHSEQNGRWAGPENKSTIMFPALREGRYLCEIEVTSEIDDGVLDSTKVSFNGKPISFERKRGDFPEAIKFFIEIGEDFKKPFCQLSFEFESLRSPKEWGSLDKRKLAIMINTVQLKRVD